MCRVLKIFVSAVPLGFALTAHAQTYSLVQAIERARTQNPELIALVSKRETIEAQRKLAIAPADPSFTYGIGDLAALPGESAGLRTYQMTQSLGFPGKAFVARHTLDLESSALEREIAAKNLEISRIVKTSYYDLWLSEQKLKLNSLKHSAFEQIFAAAKRMYVKNTSTDVQFLSAEATLRNIENEQIDILSSQKLSRIALNLLLGLPEDANTEIETPTNLNNEPSLDLNESKLRQQFLSTNPALASETLRLQADENRVREAKWGYLPEFSFTAGINNYNQTAGAVSMSIPLWFWWNHSSEVKAASANATVHEANLTARKRLLITQFEQKIITFEAIEKKLKNYRGTLLPNFKKAFEIALRNYSYGKIDYATLSVSAENMVSSQLEYDTLIAQAQVTLAEIEEAVGGSLP